MTASSSASTPTRHPHQGLTDTQTHELRSRLVEEREILLERAAGIAEDTEQAETSAATHGQGETEHTVVDIERRVSAVLEAHAREALDEIAAALARMDAGTYGTCEGCGTAIPGERLLAMPATRFCVACQQRADSRR